MASSVDLGARLEAFVDQMVKTGRYNSRSEILREGVRVIHERETRLAALDAAIERGIADADAGRVYEIGDVLEHIEARIAEVETRSSKQ